MLIDLSQIITAESCARTRLAEAKTAARSELASRIAALTSALSGSASLAEQLSWGRKEQAARALLDGSETEQDREILEAEVQITGEPLMDLASRVVIAAEDYRLLVAKLTGIRRRAEAMIEAALTADQIAEALREAQ